MGESLAAHGPHESGAGEGYRFTWVRTFHRPWVVRIQVAPDGAGRTIAQSLDGSPASGLGERLARRSLPVDRAGVERLRAAMVGPGFWAAASEDDRDLVALDGAEWLIEGTRAGACHSVRRWSPPPSPFRAAGLCMLRLAGIADDEIY